MCDELTSESFTKLNMGSSGKLITYKESLANTHVVTCNTYNFTLNK